MSGVRLTRPRAGAPLEVQRVYFHRLAEALNSLGVQPGDEYVVSRAEPAGGAARARRGDPSTSHEAAASTGDLRDSQRQVLMILRSRGPLTDEELVAHYGRSSPPLPKQSPSGIRSRRAELCDQGLVFDTGERRELESGRKAIVWRAMDRPVAPQPHVPLPPSLFGEDLAKAQAPRGYADPDD